ncbi:MAG: recombinase family protein [Pirellulales bacterium]
MTQWWEIGIPAETDSGPPKIRAVAYYRHSAQDRQENSIPIQQDQVREWALKNGVEIIREFADAGKSGLTSEGRPAFTEMMEEWVKKRTDFHYILCLDVSRWGRFQDIDLSAQFSAECKKHHKQVIYTTIGKPREDDPLYPVYVQFERFRAAQYSRELSDKVWRGCMKITEQGYWAGGSPPYGTRRLLLDEKRDPLHPLEPGQRKGIQNQRVTLMEGDPVEVAVIQRIFHEFTALGYSEYRIAEGLNAEGIPSPSGGRWGAGSVLRRLQNETYIGTLVYNKTTQKLKTPRRDNPPEQWLRSPDAFEGLVTTDQFTQVQEILAERRRRYDPERMLEQLNAIYQQYGVFRGSLLKLHDSAPSAGTYSRHFGALDLAFQRLYQPQRDRARQLVQERITQQVPEVLPYSDFLVLDRRLTLAIQPAIPVPHGYDAYWPIQPDSRQVIDITLGVLLSSADDPEILGYIAVPRGLTSLGTMRVTSTSTRTELFGRCDLAFLQNLL